MTTDYPYTQNTLLKLAKKHCVPTIEQERYIEILLQINVVDEDLCMLVHALLTGNLKLE